MDCAFTANCQALHICQEQAIDSFNVLQGHKRLSLIINQGKKSCFFLSLPLSLFCNFSAPATIISMTGQSQNKDLIVYTINWHAFPLIQCLLNLIWSHANLDDFFFLAQHLLQCCHDSLLPIVQN
jgi:hypothetical protein